MWPRRSATRSPERPNGSRTLPARRLKQKLALLMRNLDRAPRCERERRDYCCDYSGRRKTDERQTLNEGQTGKQRETEDGHVCPDDGGIEVGTSLSTEAPAPDETSANEHYEYSEHQGLRHVIASVANVAQRNESDEDQACRQGSNNTPCNKSDQVPHERWLADVHDSWLTMLTQTAAGRAVR